MHEVLPDLLITDINMPIMDGFELIEAVRALVVDDSASMRATLKRILAADPEIEVVGLAPEPHAAREMIKALDPDVLTLDVEMPGMDGISFLERIMRLRPMPVVMCSTLTARGAAATIQALRLGAVDYVTKPAGNPDEIARDAKLLCAKVKAAARAQVQRGPIHLRPAASAKGAFGDAVIAIGASTGGVETLFALLKALPSGCPPILIVQHMPAAYTGNFAERLNGECALHVVEAVDRMPVVPGTVYIAPGGMRHMELEGGIRGSIRLREGERVGEHRPAINVLFRSVAATTGGAAVGVILTGMGCDGADGLLQMRRAGCRTLGQNEASCVVYGMPRAALEIGAVEQELSLSAMPETILAACRGTRGGGD